MKRGRHRRTWSESWLAAYVIAGVHLCVCLTYAVAS